MNYEAAHTVPTVDVWGCLFLTYIHKFWGFASFCEQNKVLAVVEILFSGADISQAALETM